MSMLAERRRKNKWIINPTKKPIWVSDSSGIKFGKELMEKMGWSAGKGLGANEQGIQDPLKVSYKNDSKGIGFKDNDDQWIEHQDEFNILLDQLKTFSSVRSTLEKEKNEFRNSLEEKSKNSRVRLHYQKFLRGKDLSRYSESDLACILGTSKLNKKKLSVEGEVETKSSNNNNIETNFGVTTINGGSLEDYFKKKWIFSKQSSRDLSKSFSTEKSDFLENLKAHDESNISKKDQLEVKAYFDNTEMCESEKCEKIKTNDAEIEPKAKKIKKTGSECIVDSESQQIKKNYLDFKQKCSKDNENENVNENFNSVRKRKKPFKNNEKFLNEYAEGKGLCSMQAEPSYNFMSEQLGLENEFSKKKKKKKVKEQKQECNERIINIKYSNESNSESVALNSEKEFKKKKEEGENNAEVKHNKYSNNENCEAVKLESETHKRKNKIREGKADDCDMKKFSKNLNLPSYDNNCELMTQLSSKKESSKNKNKKEKKKKTENDEIVKGMFSDTLLHNKSPEPNEFSVKSNLNKKKWEKDKKEEFHDEQYNTDEREQVVRSSHNVKSNLKKKKKKRKKSKQKGAVENKEKTNQNSLDNAVNGKTEGNEIKGHKLEFLNDKRADKFYPGEHTNLRVQRLFCWVNLSEFKGSNLGSIVGYGRLLKCENKSQ